MLYKMKDINPHVRNALRNVTRKQSVSITVTDQGTDNFGTNWSGGSRRVLSYLNLTTGRFTTNGITTCSAFHGKPQDIPMIAGHAILDCGTFCGKPSVPCLYVHPDDVASVVGQELVTE